MEKKSSEVSMEMVEELLRETELKEETISGEDTVEVQESHLVKKVLDCSHCKLAESANYENKKKIEELRNELKSMQEKVKEMEARRDSDTRKLSEDALLQEDACFIKFEKEDRMVMVNKWVSPPEGYLKLNIDALKFWKIGGGTICTAVGAVIRDHKGNVYRSMYCNFRGNLSDIMFEVTAMREGLRWVKTLSLPDGGLIVDTESLLLAEQLGSSREESSEYGLAVTECRLLLRSFYMDDIVVKPIKREANLLAHEIAIIGCACLISDTHHGRRPKYLGDALQYDHITSIVDSERPFNLNY